MSQIEDETSPPEAARPGAAPAESGESGTGAGAQDATAAWTLLALQALLVVIAGGLLAHLALPTSAVWLERQGVAPWMLPMMFAIVAAAGYGLAVASLSLPDAFSAGALRPALWPQPVLAMLWSALFALFVAAVPYHGGDFPAGAFAVQAGIFVFLFALASWPLGRALRRGARAE